MDSEKIILLAVLGIVAVVFVWGVVSVAGSQQKTASVSFSQDDYSKALAAENASNICATPAGYTDDSWKEHMGHHPDRYAECLK